MIDTNVMKLVERYDTLVKQKGVAVSLGDQQVQDPRVHKTAEHYFKSRGFDRYFDIDYNGNAELNLDLNEPLPTHFEGIASLLFDGGTAEHVCNVGECWKTTVKLVRVGGLFIGQWPVHTPPGQSFYMVDPIIKLMFEANGFQTLQHDYYQHLNFRMWLWWQVQTYLPVSWLEKKRLEYKHKAVLSEQTGKGFNFKRWLLSEHPGDIKTWPAGGRTWKHPALTCQVYVGFKLQNVETFVWPQQASYPKNRSDLANRLTE